MQDDKSKHDWTVLDPQIAHLKAEGVNETQIAKRLGLGRQTLIDHLRPKRRTRATVTAEAPVTVDPAPDTPTVNLETVSPIEDTVPVTEVIGPLSLDEQQTLAHYEAIITEGIQTFVEVGRALLAIRDQRLYRERYLTFEAYLSERWDLSRPHAYHLMDAYQTVKVLSTVTDVVPANEAQARPLAGLSPEQQVEVWTEAVKTAPEGKVTAQHVKAVVNQRRTHTKPPPPPKPPTPDPMPAARKWAQDELVRLLSLVPDTPAWDILGELYDGIDAYVELQPNTKVAEAWEKAWEGLFDIVVKHDYKARIPRRQR